MSSVFRGAKKLSATGCPSSHRPGSCCTRCRGRTARLDRVRWRTDSHDPSGGRALVRLAHAESHARGLERKLGSQVVCHRPADHAAREDVHDRSQEHPALPCPDAGRVRNQDPLLSGSAEPLRTPVRNRTNASYAPRDQSNILKRLLMHAGVFSLGRLLRHMLRSGRRGPCRADPARFCTLS
jgi:hypothetical protein